MGRYLAGVGCRGNFEEMEIAEKVHVQDCLGLSSVIIQSADEMFTGEECLVRYEAESPKKVESSEEEDDGAYYDLETPMRETEAVYNDLESQLLDAVANEWLAFNALGEHSEVETITAKDYSGMLERLICSKTDEEYRGVLNQLSSTLGNTAAIESYVSFKKAQRAEEEARLAKKAARGQKIKTA